MKESAAFTEAFPPSSGKIPDPRSPSRSSSAFTEHEGVHAAMKRLIETPAKGLGACLASLKTFGATRISEVPRERYGEFIEYVVAQTK